jgi:hypothetical protein
VSSASEVESSGASFPAPLETESSLDEQVHESHDMRLRCRWLCGEGSPWPRNPWSAEAKERTVDRSGRDVSELNADRAVMSKPAAARFGLVSLRILRRGECD